MADKKRTITVYVGKIKVESALATSHEEAFYGARDAASEADPEVRTYKATVLEETPTHLLVIVPQYLPTAPYAAVSKDGHHVVLEGYADLKDLKHDL